MKSRWIPCFALITSLALLSCNNDGSSFVPGPAGPTIHEAVCVIHPTDGHAARGVVRFIQIADQVKVVADIEGLNANQLHGIHIHEFGDVTRLDGKSCGGHYNPTGAPHSLPPESNRHAGDLGNLESGPTGQAHFELIVKNISIAGAKNPILGRGVIIHAKPDDGGQPTGNAGARIGYGVIGTAKPAG